MAPRQNTIEERPDLPWEETKEDLPAVARPQVAPPTMPLATPTEADAAAAAAEKRRAALLDNIRHDYWVVGDAYYFRDRPDALAFKDNGSKLVTASNSKDIALSMAALAEAKGWKGISVSGHADFRREVWLEARLRGIAVVGYEPKPQDKAELAARLERTLNNTVAGRQSVETGTPAAPPKKAPEQREARLAEAAQSSRVVKAKDLAVVAPAPAAPSHVVKNDELEKRAVVKAVAKALAESQVKDPRLVEKILAQVDKVLDQRQAAGKAVPTVPIYDVSAPQKQKQEVSPTQHSSRSR